MPAYVAVQVVINDPVSYERYKKLTPPSIEPFGGKFLARGGATEALEGTWKPSRFVLLEFPSMERARAWWNSPEYAEAKKLRQASANTEMLLIEGVG
jgi:uncharacterized protein (DUF1330 family)